MIGEVIGNFKLVSRLGRGGMGEVWLAEHQSVGTNVAIKLLMEEISEEVEHVQRFFNEARAVSRIQHAGIAKIFDVGTHAGRAYLIMEYLDGETLARRIARNGRLERVHLADIGRQIASVLEATHSAGITHRDLKPENVFIVPDRGTERGERVKILDFGIAKLTGTLAGASPRTSGTLGTPAYMAPEQWGDASQVDWRADLYSLGCLAFEMACGRPPFIVTNVAEACAKHLHDPPPLASSIAPATPRALDELIASLLEKRPEARPRSMREVVEAFDAIGRGRSFEGLAATVAATGASVVRRRSRAPLAIAMTAIVAGVGGYAFPSRSQTTVAPPDAAIVTTKSVDAAVPPAAVAPVVAPAPAVVAPARHRVVRSKPAEPAPPVKEGTVDGEEVRRRIVAHERELDACYLPHAQRDPTQTGRTMVEFTIGTDGRASNMSANGMTDVINGCVIGIIRGVVFPRPVGGPVVIHFPFAFETEVLPSPASSAAIPGAGVPDR